MEILQHLRNLNDLSPSPSPRMPGREAERDYFLLTAEHSLIRYIKDFIYIELGHKNISTKQ
jgi:hypothetical protein